MHMKKTSLRAVLTMVLLSSALNAQWSHNPTINTPVVNVPGTQTDPSMASDGAGGMIIAWSDYRNGSWDIYTQHLNAAGVALWKSNGIPICTAAGTQYLPAVVSDGAGGAVIAWGDFTGSGNIYAQRVDADGSIHAGWAPNGVPMTAAASVTSIIYPFIVSASDGAGGAIVAWEDDRDFGTTDYDIYAQHIDGNGTIHAGWAANGVPISTAAAAQFLRAIASDGAGGAIITWQDDRGGVDYDVYAQRIDGNGAIHSGWTTDGNAICTAVGQQTNPQIAPDGSGGAVITWSDIRGGVDFDIYAQRIDGNGAIHSGWTTDGNALCTASGSQLRAHLISDGAGGAIVTWMDGRVDDDIYAQHIDGNGAIHGGWPANGAAVSTAGDLQQYPSIISDGAGGAIMSWTDHRSGTDLDIYAGRIDAGGSIHSGWVSNGTAVCTAAHDQFAPTVMADDGQNGAIIAWIDTRGLPADTDYHVYTQRILADGTLPTTISGLAFDDLNGNGSKDLADTAAPGWKIYLFRPQTVKQDSAVTSINGVFAFTNLTTGTYYLAEAHQPGWTETHPVSPDTFTVVYQHDSADVPGKNFGNTYGELYVGSSGGNWSNPANWLGTHVPGPADPAVIRTTVTVDGLPSDSIRSLIVPPGGTLNFTAGSPLIKVRDSIRIDPGSVIHYPGSEAGPRAPLAAAAYVMKCYGNWINYGTFVPGISRVIFPASGSNIGGPTTFYDLEISGPLATISDNKTVTDTLLLHYGVTPGLLDTVFITNPAYTAIKDTGRIFRGSVKRAITQGETNLYRFESAQSYLQFDGTGTYPTAFTMTALPATTPPTSNLKWLLVGGTPNPAGNYVTVDSVKSFSKWVIGIPGSEALPKSAGEEAISTSEFGTPEVLREYVLKPEGGSGFRSRLELWYKQSEVLPAQDETQFQLLRGPLLIDTVQAHWNMVSVPLVPEVTKKDSLFPTATSAAFSFSGAYTIHQDLGFGQGYWLKFPSKQAVRILGGERHSSSTSLSPGWNMIGVPTFASRAASATTTPPGIISSQIFGYKSGYSIADTLRPLRAYWVKATTSGQILITDTSGLLPKTSPSLDEEFSRLIVSDHEGNSSKLYFATQGKIDRNLYELPPVPPDEAFDARFGTGTMLETADPRQVRDIPLEISALAYPLKISWQLVGNASASLIVENSEVHLRTRGGEISLKSPGTSVRLRLAPSSLNVTLPGSYSLEQNYPNPFNPTTLIPYELPEQSRVTLTIYDLLGQRVKTLVDEVEVGGSRTAEWRGTNDAGHLLASGVYFYRMEARSVDGSKVFVKTRHMLLVR